MIELKLLTTDEVAKLLRKSKSWLINARWSGVDCPPYRKLGRSVVYDERDVIGWIEAHNLQTSTSDRRD
ncbi:helix-turn-helix transcriptional regulator [Candidatus Neomarinimicrobiota bacterium]